MAYHDGVWAAFPPLGPVHDDKDGGANRGEEQGLMKKNRQPTENRGEGDRGQDLRGFGRLPFLMTVCLREAGEGLATAKKGSSTLTLTGGWRLFAGFRQLISKEQGEDHADADDHGGYAHILKCGRDGEL